jgi:hypothetical protein
MTQLGPLQGELARLQPHGEAGSEVSARRKARCGEAKLSPWSHSAPQQPACLRTRGS